MDRMGKQVIWRATRRRSGTQGTRQSGECVRGADAHLHRVDLGVAHGHRYTREPRYLPEIERIRAGALSRVACKLHSRQHNPLSSSRRIRTGTRLARRLWRGGQLAQEVLEVRRDVGRRLRVRRGLVRVCVRRFHQLVQYTHRTLHARVGRERLPRKWMSGACTRRMLAVGRIVVEKEENVLTWDGSGRCVSSAFHHVQLRTVASPLPFVNDTSSSCRN